MRSIVVSVASEISSEREHQASFFVLHAVLFGFVAGESLLRMRDDDSRSCGAAVAVSVSDPENMSRTNIGSYVLLYFKPQSRSLTQNGTPNRDSCPPPTALLLVVFIRTHLGTAAPLLLLVGSLDSRVACDAVFPLCAPS